MAEVRLQVKGLDEFMANMRRAPTMVIQIADEVIQRIGIHLQTQGREEAPRDTGLLRNQIQYASLALAKAEVISKAEYSHEVHEGRPPNKKIHDRVPLERWAKRHGINTNYGVNLLIAHIERFGTDGQPFFEIALDQSKHFIESHLQTGADLMADRIARG